MKRGPKIICLRRKVLAAVGCVAAAILMCWVTASPEVVLPPPSDSCPFTACKKT